MISRGTPRKIEIIESFMGSDWKEKYPDKSIDAIFRIISKDERLGVYFKTTKETKIKLREMLEYYETTAADLFGMMINLYYEHFREQVETNIKKTAEDYTGL